MVEIELTTAQQLTVIEHICSGGTLHSAATSVNVPLKDILAWRRESRGFRAALDLAFAGRDLLRREQAAAPPPLQKIDNCTIMHKASPAAGLHFWA
ncbi:MAG: hypothetical protein ACLQVN_23565 [Bryobacteraceae bacterium]